MPNPRRHFGNKWWKDPDTGELQSVFLYDHERDFQGGRPYVDYGSNQYYQLGATGGTDLVRFSASMNWDREFGVFPRHTNLNKRQGGRFNIDFLASEDLTVSASLGYVHRYHERPEVATGRGPMINMVTGVHPNRAPIRRGMDFAVPEDIEDITTWVNTTASTGQRNGESHTHGLAQPAVDLRGRREPRVRNQVVSEKSPRRRRSLRQASPWGADR